jgi:ABC-2 type transport system ATP-binding protein
LQPRQGNITIDGFDRKTRTLEIKRFSAFLPAQPYVYPNFTARRWMKMVADIYEVPPETRDERMERLIRMFDLAE